MKIAIVCMTPRCMYKGSAINIISGISPDLVDAFYEDYNGSDSEDVCLSCGQPGIAIDPQPEEKDV